MKENIQLSKLENTIFYTIEKTIKTYRQFGQRQLKANGMDITIDQWLILKTISDEPSLTQKEIADKVFKDYASITRIIELLVQRNYLRRSFNQIDRRRHKLELTSAGKKAHEKLVPIVYNYRKTALHNLSLADVKLLHGLLDKISKNLTS